MEKIKVLISGVGGDVGQGVIKALKKSSLNLEVYKICAYNNSSWLHMDNFSFIAPLCASDEYLSFLIKLLKKYNINVFFPCVDSEISKISQNKKIIERQTNAVVFVDDPDKIIICDDKFKTFEFLKKHNFPYPETIIPERLSDIKALIDRVGFPLVAKKRISGGSKNVEIVNSYAEARIYIGEIGYILQELLHSDEGEFTGGVYLGYDAEIKGVCTLRREMKGGSTYRAERVIVKEWEDLLGQIAKKLRMKYVNIQFRKKNGEIHPFEFNGRFSGTTGILSRIFNAPEMFIREKVLGEKIQRIENNEKFYVMRYYEEIYVDGKRMQSLIERSKKI